MLGVKTPSFVRNSACLTIILNFALHQTGLASVAYFSSWDEFLDFTCSTHKVMSTTWVATEFLLATPSHCGMSDCALSPSHKYIGSTAQKFHFIL